MSANTSAAARSPVRGSRPPFLCPTFTRILLIGLLVRHTGHICSLEAGLQHCAKSRLSARRCRRDGLVLRGPGRRGRNGPAEPLMRTFTFSGRWAKIAWMKVARRPVGPCVKVMSGNFRILIASSVSTRLVSDTVRPSPPAQQSCAPCLRCPWIALSRCC